MNLCQIQIERYCAYYCSMPMPAQMDWSQFGNGRGALGPGVDWV